MQMQNKNNFFKTTYSATTTRYYRSFKYNINQSTACQPHSTTAVDFHPMKPDQTQQSRPWRKPTSYSVKKNNRLKEELSSERSESIVNPQLKVSYLQTWDSLLKPVEKEKTKGDAGQSKTERVFLPSIIDFEPSNFTSLDPLFIPFEHIQQGIKDLKKELPAPKVEMDQIHHDMVNFQEKILKELEQTQKFGLKQFERLRKMLRADQVLTQQTNMRFRRQNQDLVKIDQAFKLNFQTTKPRLDVLQQQIFSCKPFDLTRNSTLDQQFPQQYF